MKSSVIATLTTIKGENGEASSGGVTLPVKDGLLQVGEDQRHGCSEIPPMEQWYEFFAYEVVAVSHLGDWSDEL